MVNGVTETSTIDCNPYVEAKTGRLELKGGIDVLGNAFKGIFTWPKFSSLRLSGDGRLIDFGDSYVGAGNRLLYSPQSKSPVMRWLNNGPPGSIRSDPVRLEQIGMAGKIGGVMISGGAHVRRLGVDLQAIGEITPENTTVRQMTAVYTDSFSAGANIFTATSYAIGILFALGSGLKNIAPIGEKARYAMTTPRLGGIAYWILLVQCAAVCWGESSTWIMNGIATFRAEEEHRNKTGENNMSAYALAPCDLILGVSTFYRNKFVYGEARAAFAAGKVAEANGMLVFYAVDYGKKMWVPFLGPRPVRSITWSLSWAAEGVRASIDLIALSGNLYQYFFNPDDPFREKRLHNAASACMGMAAGLFTILSVPLQLYAPLAPYAFACTAVTTAIRIGQSRYDHSGEKRCG